jgi:hypothetical protein
LGNGKLNEGEKVSKYNARKTVIDGIEFDSQAEGKYYLNLLNQKREGVIKDFTLQPRFTLQEAFEKNGKKYRKIEYVADFEVVHLDEDIEIIDVKGFETPDFKIKRKLFEKRYPYKLNLVKYVKKYGGWVTVDEWRKLKREEKKK